MTYGPPQDGAGLPSTYGRLIGRNWTGSRVSDTLYSFTKPPMGAVVPMGSPWVAH